MSRYYEVSFNDTLWLSKTGLESDMKCRVNLPNAFNLRSGYVKTAFTDMNGNSVVQRTSVGKKSFDIPIEVETWLPSAVMEALFEIEDGQNEDDDVVTVQFVHDTAPNYDLEVEIMSISWSRVEFDKYFEPVIRVRTYQEAS